MMTVFAISLLESVSDTLHSSPTHCWEHGFNSRRVTSFRKATVGGPSMSTWSLRYLLKQKWHAESSSDRGDHEMSPTREMACHRKLMLVNLHESSCCTECCPALTESWNQIRSSGLWRLRSSGAMKLRNIDKMCRSACAVTVRTYFPLPTPLKIKIGKK